MTELRLCPACKRHVATREITCPFCAHALSPARGQHIVLAGRVSRAAVFSAALAACSNEKASAPAPAPAPAQGSDDLEKLLDTDERVVPHGDTPPPIDASVADAAAVDASVPVDAGVVRKKKKKQVPDDQIRPLDVDKVRIQNDHIHAKPYGAPPARRRIV